jgi:transcriptional regulator with XRE-family HTH domain
MDMVRIGRIFRAVRIRKHWRQADLARRAEVSETTIRRIEHGEGASFVLATLLSVAVALEIRLDVRANWRGGDLDRMLNSGHAAMHEAMAASLGAVPSWVWSPEVSFSIYGERGVIDILAFHAESGSHLIIELKTDLVDVQDLIGVMDRRRRLGPTIARGLGWDVKSVSCWVVIADSSTNRRRLAAHATVLRHAFPVDGRRIRTWLGRPDGAVNALSFLSNPRMATGKGNGRLPKRVRKAP